jgi:hypothetical protein
VQPLLLPGSEKTGLAGGTTSDMFQEPEASTPVETGRGLVEAMALSDIPKFSRGIFENAAGQVKFI